MSGRVLAGSSDRRESRTDPTRAAALCLLPAVVAKYGEHRGHGLMQSLKKKYEWKAELR